MASFGAVVELSSLDGSNGFQMSGEAALDRSGWSVSGAGDVNGDGLADLIVGAPSADPDGTSSGASYVVFGSRDGFDPNLNLSTLDGENGFQASGSFTDFSGRSVSGAGDVNGDGIDDVIIGAPLDDVGALGSGTSYVIFGTDEGFAADLNLSTLDGANGFLITGEAANDQSGYSVSGAGDVNGDGIADLIVGAWGAGSASGASYVVFGTGGGFAASVSLSALNGSNGFQISGEVAGDRSGWSVSDAGDVNGDGVDDLILGAPVAGPNGAYSGASYVVFGSKEDFDANLDLSTLNGTNGFQISGEITNGRSGYSVSGAGDINGDGLADLIVGAYKADSNGTWSGASYVVFGRGTVVAADLNLSTLNGSNGFKINSEAAFDYSGFSVSGAGDVNGDGLGDLIVGAYKADSTGGDSGASYVVFGTDEGFDATLDLSTLDGLNGFKINGEATGDRSGFSVSDAGDVNGDGIDDLIVGAWGVDANASDAGASYVIFGIQADLTFGGTGGDDTLKGRSGDDTLTGFGGNDRLDGKAGADDMAGGAGDDVYFVDNRRDAITELENEGFDHVTSSVDFSLSSHVEKLVLTGSAVNGTGNDGDNQLFGNAEDNILIGLGGNDRIDGRGGADDMQGGTGNDTYYVDDLGDTITEADGEGADRVYIGVDAYGLADDQHVEVLILQEHFSLAQLAGNNLANRLFGNAQDNVLLGEESDDHLDGRGKNDTLEGGTGNDRMLGGAGDDFLNGGGGADVLRGGVGGDSFYFSDSSEGRDTIADFATGMDTIALDTGLFAPGGPTAGTLGEALYEANAIGVASDADTRLIYNARNGLLWFDSDGSGSGAAVQLARLTRGLELLASDFEVVA